MPNRWPQLSQARFYFSGLCQYSAISSPSSPTIGDMLDRLAQEQPPPAQPGPIDVHIDLSGLANLIWQSFIDHIGDVGTAVWAGIRDHLGEIGNANPGPARGGAAQRGR